MKYAAALSLAVAPLAIAKAVNNVYPAQKRSQKGMEMADDKKAGLIQGLSLGSATQVIVIWANPGNNAETTTVHDQVTVTKTVDGAMATAPPEATATHTVTVGGSAGLVYTPPEIKANVGDMVIFEFMSANHTASQSTFAEPCKLMEGGMDSGFMPNANNTVDPPPKVAMQVMTTDPQWFYCRQKGHCGKGMVFSINPSAEKTQAIFQSMAIAQNGTGDGSALTGNGTMSAPPPDMPAAPPADPAAAPPASTTAAAGAAASSDVTMGSGVVEGGACVCAVQCGAGSFPAMAAQGVGAFGGIPGSLPSSMMETP
ncbi:Cupredoxin [Hypoxylon sp. FL1284]|nr:Cupredoxin [Hypoxylon sp. FL1284]